MRRATAVDTPRAGLLQADTATDPTNGRWVTFEFTGGGIDHCIQAGIQFSNYIVGENYSGIKVTETGRGDGYLLATSDAPGRVRILFFP